MSKRTDGPMVTVAEANSCRLNTVKHLQWLISNAETVEECQAMVAAYIAELEGEQ